MLALKLIATLHNRRGDPLILLRFLKTLVQQGKVSSIGVAWSVPSGETEPSWEELLKEERRIQEVLRSAVRLVHNSSLSWEAKSFLGRCYRSFQYEFMVSLNLKRHDQSVRLVFIDDPEARETRYKEIGSPTEFLREIASYPNREQVEVLRSRYAEYKEAYERIDIYEKMILRPESALLEFLAEHSGVAESRTSYMSQAIANSNPDVVLVRLIHCLDNLPPTLARLDSTSRFNLATRLGLGQGAVTKLSEAEVIVGPLPARD